jgi:periplasmic divalent cation tolerance protein
MDSIWVVTTTFDSEKECLESAERIVEIGLASCCQVVQIHSIYRWKGESVQAPEFQLTCKTLKRDELAEYITMNHSYEVPEILIQSIETTPAYYQYILHNQ